ncbi:MAG: PKD domain-containing protein [Flavobacteriales bacterium]
MNKVKRPIDTLLKVIFLGLFCLLFQPSFAQVFSEYFGTSSTCSDIDTLRYSPNNQPPGSTYKLYMTGSNSQDTTNRWFVSSRESGQPVGACATSCTGLNNTLHVSTNSGTIDPNSTYHPDSAANVFAYLPIFDPSSTNGDLRVEFDYLEGGNATDNGSFVINIGLTNFHLPPITYDPPKTVTSLCPGGEWKHAVYYLPGGSFNTLAQVFFGFRWVNDNNGIGSAPSFAIDNFEVFETLPLTKIGNDSTITICNGGTINFKDSSEGNPTAWLWDFDGAAANSTLQNPSVTFNTNGTYNVILESTNNNGSSYDTVIVTVVTCSPPTPGIASIPNDPSNLCQGQCVDFADASTPGTYGMGEWHWQFQGGTPSTSDQQNPGYICFFAPGTYDVILTVKDTASGLDSTITFTAYVTVTDCQVPTAAFNQDTTRICNNDCIEFYSLSLGNPENLRWQFGDSTKFGNPFIEEGLTDDLDTVTACFTVPGIYTVKLTAWSGDYNDPLNQFKDDTLGIFQQIIVDSCPPPLPDFTVSSQVICPGTYVVFQDLSLYATEWEWEFPGGQPSLSIDQNPEVLYDSAGFYPVILTVKNVNGDSTLIIEEYIQVDSCLDPLPRFTVESDSICRGTCVQFFNTSLRADSIFWIFWRHPDMARDTTIFGDTVYLTTTDTIIIDTLIPGVDFLPLYYTRTGVSSLDSISVDTLFMAQDPIFCYNDSMVIGVQLFAFNQYGVSIENSQDVAILNVGGEPPVLKPGPDKYVRIDNINSRFFLIDTVKFEPVGTGQFYAWYPQEGLSCYDCKEPIIHPTYTRKYFITNYDDYGCQAFDSVIVFVEESYYAGIPNIFSPNGDGNNDILWVRGNAIADDGFVMRVWNRYGEMVFESYSQNEGWDGTFKGAPAPMGAYTYYVKVTFIDDVGTVDELTGTVMLVRH